MSGRGDGHVTFPTEAHNSWVERVLGVQPVAAGTISKQRSLMPIWRETRGALDDQVAAMQQRLRGYNHPDYDAIASFGFNGLTGQRNTKLMAALLDYDRQPSPDAADTVSSAIDGYGELLGPGSVLDDYDVNPLGVAVTFRATLEYGLANLRAALAARPGA